MLPRFEIVGRQRPVAVVGVPFLSEECGAAHARSSAAAATAHLAPCAAIEVSLASGADARVTATLTGPDGSELAVSLDGSAVSLAVTTDGRRTDHRSRRHGRCTTPPTRLALTLTGPQLSALTHEGDRWVVRGRVDLRERLDTRDIAWLAGLTSGWEGEGVRGWSAGTFGQLGLRDLRLVTTADGSPYGPDGRLLFTASSAGPGFFDTGHTSVWTCDPAERAPTLRHTGDLWFEREDRPGAFDDHATHLVREGDHWLVATSTWADFPADRRQQKEATVGITLAASTADLTSGQHRLATRPLDLPTEGPSVGVWDPHLVRTESGEWLVGYVSARRFFDFHPVLASGASLDSLALRAAATDRRATEGTTLVRDGDAWVVLASDGRDNPRALRARYPVLDLDLRETGTLEAPYPTNLPWPTLVPPAPGAPDSDWLLVTFDGTPYGGRLPGYGTHGDVVVMRPVT